MNKCAVFGCKRGYESEEPQHEDYHAFYFPLDERKSHLLPAWEKFVCRDGWKPSANSVICEFHFEDRLIRKGKRWTLKWKLNPMPTMLTDEMKAMPQSVQLTPAGMCGQHILKFLIGFLPRLTFVVLVQNITIGD